MVGNCELLCDCVCVVIWTLCDCGCAVIWTLMHVHVIVVNSCLLSGRAYKKSCQPVVISLVFTIVIVSL